VSYELSKPTSRAAVRCSAGFSRDRSVGYESSRLATTTP
jgi:hypothetical protein